MSDSVLERYSGAGRNSIADSLPAAAGDADAAENLGAFGWLRGTRELAVSLELRKKTGNIVAIPYGWIERFEFDPSEGITLHVGGQKIRIEGRNLNGSAKQPMRLFQGIVRQKVPWIQENDQAAALKTDHGATIVEKIEW